MHEYCTSHEKHLVNFGWGLMMPKIYDVPLTCSSDCPKWSIRCHQQRMNISLQTLLNNYFFNRLFSYPRQSWQSQWCSSGRQRRTGRASRSECPQPPLSSFSTCTQSPPWGSRLKKKEQLIWHGDYFKGRLWPLSYAHCYKTALQRNTT